MSEDPSGFTQKELLLELRSDMKQVKQDLSTHIRDSAAAVQRLDSLEKSHYSLRHDFEGRDGNNGFKGQTRIAIAELKVKWAVFTSILAIASSAITAFILQRF